MLEITQTAINVIKRIAPGQAGLRVFTSGGERDVPALQVEIAEEPRSDDRVVEAGGAHVFLEPRAADTLDDKLLDATQDEHGVHFAVTPQRPPRPTHRQAGA